VCTQEADGQNGLEKRIGKNLEVIVAAALGILLGAYLVKRAGLMEMPPVPAAVPCVSDVDKPQKQGKASPRARVSP
tara:strand:+ start:507 stop:734 length:228 start_codon:yes stop_codon:yes gene_type:complete